MKNFIIILTIIVSFFACQNKFTPKPYGYFRVYLPEHSYRTLDTLNLPYRFEISRIANVVLHSEKDKENWLDINYPYFNASIFCSYMPVKNNLLELSEDARRYVYKHSVKADDISEQPYENSYLKVYGILYDLKGNTASSVQFALTDSTKRFFRAALYFDNRPNQDSVAPMNDYIRQDIVHLIETFEWK
ncbi:MAG: gliding motility lipoprotein GldD [Paludibacter sp.]|jgi:gliding motility-associated lipoprotein GldD|nr:gliding motility lipoprotein GldD [Paludibacter sp.]